MAAARVLLHRLAGLLRANVAQGQQAPLRLIDSRLTITRVDG